MMADDQSTETTTPGRVSRGTPFKGSLLLSTSGRGKELADMLRDELGIPGEVRAFSVSFRAGEAVVVTTEFQARGKL